MAKQMSADSELSAQDQLARIIDAAEELGIEVDALDTSQWLVAMAAAHTSPGSFQVDAASGIYGHRITLLDFDPDDLLRYRRLGAIVDLPDGPNVETAISLAGSAAQSRVQPYPGDADFFERVNILADSREAACQRLGDLLRLKALTSLTGPDYELVEVKWGTYQEDVLREGEELRTGMPISWSAQEVIGGRIQAATASGEPLELEWAYGQKDPGWCKLDWVVVEPEEGRVVHASNMLDVTWETPEGEIVPLDGFLDPYFQEVYLEAESIPLFTKLIRQMSPTALQDYVESMTQEVIKYSTHDPQRFGKVAKRLYNIFRLTGKWSEAAFVRELFDEPAALLYQVASLLDTIDEAVTSGTSLDKDPLVDQVDSLIRSVVRVCEGPNEEKLVDALLRLRDDLAGRHDLGLIRDQLLEESHQLVSQLVNEYFRERLVVMPEIRLFLDSLSD